MFLIEHHGFLAFFISFFKTDLTEFKELVPGGAPMTTETIEKEGVIRDISFIPTVSGRIDDPDLMSVSNEDLLPEKGKSVV